MSIDLTWKSLSGNSASLIVIGAYIYLVDKTNGDILKINISDQSSVVWGTVKNFANSNNSQFANPAGITTDGVFLYTAFPNDNTSNIQINKIELADPVNNTIFDLSSISTQTRGLCAIGNYIYTQFGGIIYQVDKTNSSISTVLVNTNISTIGQFMLTNIGNILYGYYTNYNDSIDYIYILSVDVTSVSTYNPTFATSIVNNIGSKYYAGFVSSANRLFYALDNNFSGNEGYIESISISTPTIKKVNVANTKPLALAANSTDVYFVVYDNGFFIAKMSNTYPLDPPPPPPCFHEDTLISTMFGDIPVSKLSKGVPVKTLSSGFKLVEMVGHKVIDHPADTENRLKGQLYVCTPEKYKDVTSDLILTGCHSILVDDFTSEKEKQDAISANGGEVYVTEKKYRLPACADQRAAVYKEKGSYTIYHVALENEDYYHNYGIYANGLLVESCSKRYLKELSGMTLKE